jgi:poly(A) polymerase
VPEVTELAALSDDEFGDLHKDNFVHTLRVVAQCGPDASLVVRTAALFHDVGKPLCRKVVGREVSFHGHEEVGVRLARRRLSALGFDREFTESVVSVVLASGRIQSYLDSWTDSAVRRVLVQAGDRLDDALVLARADCTTRHDFKRERLHRQVASFVAHADRVVEADRLAQDRPVLDGDELAALGVPRGPQLGVVWRKLRDENRAGRLLDREDAAAAVRSGVWPDQGGSDS